MPGVCVKSCRFPKTGRVVATFAERKATMGDFQTEPRLVLNANRHEIEL